MKFVTHMSCTLCKTTYDKDAHILTCPACGEKGILDIHYDYESLGKVITKKYFKDCMERSIWRYIPLMSVKGEEANKTLKVGWTPLYRGRNLEKSLDIETLTFKDEGVNPTGSLKDRASVVATMKAIEEGHKTIACASTGNAASSLAGNASKMGLSTVIFVPKRAPRGKLTQLLAYGADVISVQGDYKEAFKLSRDAINHYGWYNRNAAINPHMVEGKKTVAYEIIEQLDFNPPDWIVVSVGDGCTIGGVYNGLHDFYALGLIDRIPKILGVQSEGCAPFYKAWKTGKPIEETDENTLADSIAVGIPRNPVKALRAVDKSKGAWVTVTDDAIIEAVKTLGKKEGLFCEPAAAAAYAGLEKALDQSIIKKGDHVSVILTGNGLKDPDTIGKAMKGPLKIENDLDALIDHIEMRK